MTSVKCVVNHLVWPSSDQLYFVLIWPFGCGLRDTSIFYHDVTFVTSVDLPHIIWLSSWCDLLDVTFCLWPLDVTSAISVGYLGTLRQISPVFSWCDLLDSTFVTRVVLSWCDVANIIHLSTWCDLLDVTSGIQDVFFCWCDLLQISPVLR